jgi:hypothetical protein
MRRKGRQAGTLRVKRKRGGGVDTLKGGKELRDSRFNRVI